MEPSHPSSHRSPPDLRALEQQIHALRLTVQVALVSLVILSGALGIYLFRQVSLLRRQAESSATVAHRMATHFNLNLATQAMVFERQLVDFARTNPGFQARLGKFYTPTSAPAASPPAASPPPGTPAHP